MTSVIKVSPECRARVGLQLRGGDGHHLEAVVTTFGVFEDVGPFQERMSPGVFDTSLARSGSDIKLLVSHDWDQAAVGRAVEWRKTESELSGVFRFGSHAAAEEAWRQAEEGMWGGVSVGFFPGRQPGDNEWSQDKTQVTRHQARLAEVSLVTVPANPDARIVAVRTAGVPEVVPQPNREQVAAILARVRANAVDVSGLSV